MIDEQSSACLQESIVGWPVDVASVGRIRSSPLRQMLFVSLPKEVRNFREAEAICDKKGWNTKTFHFMLFLLRFPWLVRPYHDDCDCGPMIAEMDVISGADSGEAAHL
ncbi:hypothetical protein [Telmatospirillum siberiense]|uniref:hypothetical protein n=1 Tax=Telmatospirillum siberiense TaxID=382514 RepID=UPI0011AED495|nr:hypothetical protein [Telmatospirillum siberiense]